MAKGWQCDECKRWFRGERPRYVHAGDPAADPTWADIGFHHRPEGGKFEPDICPECVARIGAPLFVGWLLKMLGLDRLLKLVEEAEGATPDPE